METKSIIAKADTTINASVDVVWKALVTPSTIKKYMFGSDVVSDWREGAAIRWKGQWKGTFYEDKGVILEMAPPKKLSYSHFSPLTGESDIPENYHTVTIELNQKGSSTDVSLTQDNNKNEDGKRHSEKNWSQMLSSLKQVVEQDN